MSTENMVKAGKGGLTFASDWDSTIEYDRLTGVRYDNKLFFSKKPVPIGLIPEDGEYWFLAYEGLTDEQWEALLNGTQQVGDSAKLGGKEASEYALDTDLANYLPLSGGTVKNGTDSPLIIENDADNSTEVYERFVCQNVNGAKHTAYFGAKDGKPRVGGVGGWGDILHTGNKPSGTYTGNGDATQRNVEIGGIGELLYVTPRGSSWLFAIVTRRGYIAAIDENTLVRGTDAYLNGDLSLRLMTTSSVLNASGQIYEYQRL